jgi:endoglucanase
MHFATKRVCAALLIGVVAVQLVGCGDAQSAAPPVVVVSPVAAPTLVAPTATPLPALTPELMLRQSWESYRREFIQDDGRTKDPMRDLATTSEGQSYSLLRAVWMDDQATFERVLAWTNANLRVRGDELFGFLWGRHADGSWSMLDQAVATDADQDIALALIFAHRRWGDQRYLDQARAILRDLWAKTVVIVDGRPYITAGDWAPAQPAPTLNPSYLAPYAYRIFAAVDPSNNWAGLVDTSYTIIEACSAAPLDKPTSAYIPPNWCALDTTTGGVLPPMTTLDTNFGYDAFRTYWRVALDARWFNEPRAYAYLHASSMLREVWLKERTTSAIYYHDGAVAQPKEDPTLYGGLMGNLLLTDSVAAERLYQQEMAPRFTTRDGHTYWADPANYYLQNWMWFGVALYADALPNLAK